jgi:hypothetical protein
LQYKKDHINQKNHFPPFFKKKEKTEFTVFLVLSRDYPILNPRHDICNRKLNHKNITQIELLNQDGIYTGIYFSNKTCT